MPVVTDVSSGVAQFNLQGPHSRELLRRLVCPLADDVSNEGFPFRTARELSVGYARVLCVRITYVGELGYELYVPAEMAAHVHERICEVGESEDFRQWQAAQFAEAAADTEADIDTAGLLGLKHAGLKALSSLRLEKGYRDYGHDMVRVRMSECVCASMLVCTCACVSFCVLPCARARARATFFR